MAPDSGVVRTARELTLAARILVEQHRFSPLAVNAILQGAWHLEGRRFVAGRHAPAR